MTAWGVFAGASKPIQVLTEMRRLDPGDVMHAVQPVRMRGPCALGICRKQHIETATFGRLCHLDKALEIDTGIGVRIGMAP